MKNINKVLLPVFIVVAFTFSIFYTTNINAEELVNTEESNVLTAIVEPQDPNIVLSKTSVYNTEKQSLNYTINWAVEGADVDSLIITDTLPAWTGGAISSISVPPNPALLPGDLSFDPNNPTDNREIRWDLGPRTAGSSGSITFRVEIWADNTCDVGGNQVSAVASYGEESTIEASASSDKIKVKNARCEVPETPTATISGVKIVCDSEDDLPNWGFGGADITSTTASEFLASDLEKDEKQDCHLDDWKFQWAPSSASNPGDNTSLAGEPWTTFNTETSVTVPAGEKIWVREQAKEDYIPFSGATTNLDDVASKNSAEFYCNSDVLNYDNYDFISPVEAGKTYHCIGFNVKKVEQPPACDAEASQTIFSDKDTQVDANNAVPLSFIHPAWTAAIPGATWIWVTDPVESPTNDADLTKKFTRTFSITGTPTSGTLDIASDNHYTAKVNGNVLPVVFNENNFQLGTQDSYDISSYLVTGLNTVEIEVTNKEIGESGDPAANPAGLLYKISLTNNECEVPPGGDENLSPVANAGPDQNLTLPTSSTNLDGTASTDPDGTITSYVWTFVSGPSTVDPADTASPAISGLVQGTYVFKLTVTDNDGATDDDEVTIVVSPATTPPNDDNTNRSSSSGGSRRVKPVGQVLGAETSVCNFAIDTYMRRGYQNNTSQVIILQNLLNKYLGTKLTPDGNYGASTEAAVKAFQIKYGDNILKPWGLTSPTGIFYKTTLVQAKNLECPVTILPIPAPLINWSKNRGEVPGLIR